MDVLHPRCAGIDVHKRNVVACVRVQAGSGARREIRTFGTSTDDLKSLGGWLVEEGCPIAVLESTGPYWYPVWNVLEEQVQLVLANAHEVKNVPGRKTDVSDAAWLADLLAHGLIRPSFVPERAQRDLRALTRMRKQLVGERNRFTLRIQKLLEDANIKLGNVVSDVMGQSGRRILDALVAGEQDPEHLVSLLHERVKADRTEARKALTGTVTDHHRFLLRMFLRHFDGTEASIATLDQEVERRLEPFRAKIELLKTIPGVSTVVAHGVLAEIGSDVTRFATAAHLRSWARLCPGNRESAGKRLSSRTLRGANWLKTLLVQAATAASRSKKTYYNAQYHRIRGRRGVKKAHVAVAASILTAIYYILRDQVPFHDLGPGYFDNLHKGRTTNRLVKRLQGLGYAVTLQQAA